MSLMILVYMCYTTLIHHQFLGYFLSLSLARVEHLSNLTFLMTANMWHYSLADAWVINFKSLIVFDSFHLPVFVPIIHLCVDEYTYVIVPLCVCVFSQQKVGCSCQKVSSSTVYSIQSHHTYQFEHCPQFISMIIKQHDEINGTQYDRNTIYLFIVSSFELKREKETEKKKQNHIDFYFIVSLVDTAGSCGAFSALFFFVCFQIQISFFSMAEERFLCKSMWSFAKLYVLVYLPVCWIRSADIISHISWHIFE